MKTVFSKTQGLVTRGLESLALMVFLVYIQLADMASRADWLPAYLLASSIGLAASLYLVQRGQLLNRLLLGATLYFCSGLFGLLSDWDWLNDLYGSLGAVAMLGWILATGVVTSLLSPYGFLGVRPTGYFSSAQGSALLLITAAIATLVAVSFMQHPWLGEWLPFIFLFSTRSLLLQLDQKLLRNPVTAG